MQKINLKKICLTIAGFVVLFIANAHFHIGGNEISWHDLAGDEAVITVEEFYENGEEVVTGEGSYYVVIFFSRNEFRQCRNS